MGRKPRLTFDNPLTNAQSPIRPPAGGSGQSRGPVPPSEGFSFSFDKAEEQRFPRFVRIPDSDKVEPLAFVKCIDYASDEWIREFRGRIPREGYDVDDPQERIEETPKWCKINK